MFVNSDINGWQFKSHPDYRYMLEHVSAEQGYKYLSEITHKFNLIYNANKDYFIININMIMQYEDVILILDYKQLY